MMIRGRAAWRSGYAPAFASCLSVSVGCGIIEVHSTSTSPRPNRAPPDPDTGGLFEAQRRSDAATRARDAAEASRLRQQPTLAESCATDREERRVWNLASESRRSAAQADRERRQEEVDASPEGQLRAYQLERCAKVARTEEQLADRVPCDDGSSVMRICDVYNPIGVTEYVCPASAPAPIRGRHHLVQVPHREQTTGLTDTIRVGSDPEADRIHARDRECLEWDVLAIPLQADAGGPSDASDSRGGPQ